jgi:tetratricopeptide (TPR) repeat protein
MKMTLKKGLVGIIICWGLIASFAQATTQEEQLELAKTYNDQLVQYYQQGQLNKALPLAEKALKLRTEILGEKHPRTLSSLNNLAMIYKDLGSLGKALPLSESAYRLTKEVLGAKHPRTLISLNNLAMIYKDLGSLDEALPLFESAYRLSKEVLGAKHPNTLISLNNLALIYQDLGRLDEALPLFESAYRLSKEVLGAKHPFTLTILNNLASIYQAVGKLDDALPLYESAYRLTKEVLGAKHPNTLTSLNNLAAIYQYLGRLNFAKPLYESCYHLRKEVLGAKHPFTLSSLNNLAMIYKAIGSLDEALPLFESAYRLYKEVLGAKHPNTLTSLNNLALIYQDLGRLDEALPLFESAYRLRKEVLGAKHPDTLQSLNNLAMIYKAIGRLDEALPLFESAYRLLKEVLGAKHPNTLRSLNNLALISQDLGRLDEALPLFESAYRLFKEVLGAKHPDTLSSLNNLARIYKAIGRLNEALPLYESGYRLSKEVLGAKHPNTLISLNNLALIYQDLGRLDFAKPLYESAYRLTKEVLGAHPFTLSILNNLASIYQAVGRLDDALTLSESAYHLRKEVLGAKHPDTLTSLNNLAAIYQDLGRLNEALPLYENCRSLRKEVLGAKHPDTLSSLNNLGYVYAEQAQTDKAINHFEQLREGVEALRQSGELSAENRQALFKEWIHSYFKLSQLYFEKERFNEAFQMAEMTKARTLLESMSLKLAAQNAGLSTDERNKLQQSRAQLAALNERIAREVENEKNLEHQIARESATARKLELKFQKTQLVKETAEFHRTLMQKYPKYAELNDIQIVTAKAGSSLIPAEALFISYLTQGNHVLIFTLDSTGDLQATDLGEIPNLKQTLKTYREWLSKNCTTLGKFKCEGKYVWKVADGSFIIGQKPARAQNPKQVKLNQFTHYLDNMSRDLAQKLLVPIKERLQGQKRLIISPDGALAQIPFETLIVDDEPVIATHSVSYVQSLSVLKLLKERENAYQSLTDRGTLLAMGAAPYESNVDTDKRGNPTLDIETMLTRSQNPQRYQEAFRAKGLTWDNLPNSSTELEALKNLFSDKQPLIYQGTDASEAQLQKLNKNKKNNVLAILAQYQFLVFSAHGHLDMEIPALSAIVLDQVNQTEGTDGYVTASEWPSYDLRSDLMVLSACQTGAGKVMQGEGVMGLPYAFYVAGNKNTLMTLWSVLDKSTAEFIKRFFSKLNNGQTQIDALTETKREFLKAKDNEDEEIEELEDYTLPLFWAPFVLYGI